MAELFPTQEWVCQGCGTENERGMTAIPANCGSCGLHFTARAYPAYDLKAGGVVHGPFGFDATAATVPNKLPIVTEDDGFDVLRRLVANQRCNGDGLSYFGNAHAAALDNLLAALVAARADTVRLEAENAELRPEAELERALHDARRLIAAMLLKLASRSRHIAISPNLLVEANPAELTTQTDSDGTFHVWLRKPIQPKENADA